MPELNGLVIQRLISLNCKNSFEMKLGGPNFKFQSTVLVPVSTNVHPRLSCSTRRTSSRGAPKRISPIYFNSMTRLRGQSNDIPERRPACSVFDPANDSSFCQQRMIAGVCSQRGGHEINMARAFADGTFPPFALPDTFLRFQREAPLDQARGVAPPPTAKSGTSLVTTLPAPTTAPKPIRRPREVKNTPTPSQASCSITSVLVSGTFVAGDAEVVLRRREITHIAKVAVKKEPVHREPVYGMVGRIGPDASTQ